MKLELGVGERPTPGYLRQDIISYKETRLDFIGDEWIKKIKDNSLSEVIAVGVIEHLRFKEVAETFEHIYHKLKYNGIFLFDVPDFEKWITYAYMMYNNLEIPFDPIKVERTIYGWQRWEGDEHKSCWTNYSIQVALADAGFTYFDRGQHIVNEFYKRRIVRPRFKLVKDAHIYVYAQKT